MTAISREQLHILAETAARRPLRTLEANSLRDGLTTCYAAIDHMEKRISELATQNADYLQVIRSQRLELLNAQKASI